MPGFSSLTLLAVPSRLVASQDVAGSATHEPKGEAPDKTQDEIQKAEAPYLYIGEQQKRRHGQNAEDAAEPVNNLPETPRYVWLLSLFH